MTNTSPYRTTTWILLVIVACAGWSMRGLAADSAVASDSEDRRFVEGLRRRRLYELAETYGRERLSDASLSSREATELVIQLMRVYVQQAGELPVDERETVWRKAYGLVDDFRRLRGDDPRLILVRVQAALIRPAVGELARQEAQVSDDADYEKARDAFRQAAKELTELDDSIGAMTRRANRATGDTDAPTAFELIALQNNVRHQLAMVYRNQALCYPAGSDDRVRSLNLALQSLRKVLTQIDAQDPLLWKVRVEQLICYRYLDSLDKARQYAIALRQENAPDDVRATARAEAARVELAAGDIVRAIEILADPESQRAESEELDFARLETAVAKWKDSLARKNATEATAWRDRASSLVGHVESRHGPYWGRRAERLLLNVAGDAGNVANVDILSRTADDLFRKGRYEEAVAAYENAAQAALGRADENTAFDMFYKAALVPRRQQRFQESARRFTQLGRRLRDDPRARQTHLLGIFDAGKAVRLAPDFLPQYASMLQQHLEYWPRESSSDKVRLWLGATHEARRSWSDALSVYRQIPTDSVQAAESLRAVERCWIELLRRRRRDGTPIGRELTEAVEYFEQVVKGQDGRLPERWSSAQRLGATAAARIRLNFQTDDLDAVSDMLTSALEDAEQNGGDSVDPRWMAAARLLLVASLATRPESAARAREILQRHGDSWDDPLQLLEAVRQLDTLRVAADPTTRGSLAEVQLTLTARWLEGGRPADDPTKTEIRRRRAGALVDAGRLDDAVSELRQLAHRVPDDGDVQEEFARTLGLASDRGTLSQALAQWRRVAARTRPDTEAWYRAKYHVAETQFRLGDTEKTAQMIRYLRATSPGWKDSAMAEPFERLLKKAEG